MMEEQTSTNQTMPALTEQQAWQEVRRCADGTRRYWYRTGAALNAAKEVTPHGDWLPRLEAEGIGVRAAQDMMRVAAEMTEAEALEAGSIRGALRELREANTQRAAHMTTSELWAEIDAEDALRELREANTQRAAHMTTSELWAEIDAEQERILEAAVQMIDAARECVRVGPMPSTPPEEWALVQRLAECDNSDEAVAVMEGAS